MDAGFHDRVLEAVRADDAAWFAAHPKATERVRAAFPHEWCCSAAAVEGRCEPMFADPAVVVLVVTRCGGPRLRVPNIWAA